MANIYKELSEDKLQEIENYVIERNLELKRMRDPLDTAIQEEVDLYNDKDQYIEAKKSYEEKITVPYSYTIIQTITARTKQSLFGSQNYIKNYVEDPIYKEAEKDIQKYVQSKCDIMKLKERARDYIEDSCIERTNWIFLRPVKGEEFRVEADIYSWFDVWFDTKAQKVEDSDFIIKKIIKFWRIKTNDNYFNIDKLMQTSNPDWSQEEKTKFEAKHGEDVIYYYGAEKSGTLQEVQIKEYLGWYDLSETDEPDVRPCLFTLGNDKVLIRVETIELKTDRKILLFPIIAVKQAKSLIGKGVMPLIRKQQYELNETRSLRLQNFKTLVKLLFKYKKGGSVNFSDLFAGGGNAIGYEEDPNEVDVFQIPNMVGIATAMGGEIIQDMQQTTGAVDYIMGTSGGKGHTETASGIRTITEQAMFKLGMITDNIYYDLLEVINYMFILYIKYDKKSIIEKYQSMIDFVDQTEKMLEGSYAIDIALKDLTVRRDVERSQFINASNIILPILQNTGGNVKAYLRQAMDRLAMENIDEILDPPGETQQLVQAITQLGQSNPQAMQLIQQILTDPSVAAKLIGAVQEQQAEAQAQTPRAVKESTPEEEALNEIPPARA